MKKPRGVRKSQGRKRTPKDIAARAAHFEKRLDEKIIPRALSKVSPPLSQIGTQIKTQGEFVDFAPDGTPIYAKKAFDPIVNPYQPMTVFRPDVPEEKVHDLRPLEVRDAKGRIIRTTPTGKGYIIPEHLAPTAYPDPENRMAWAMAKYQRMKELAARATPGTGFYDPAGVVSANIAKERNPNAGKHPLFGKVRVTGNWPGGRR